MVNRLYANLESAQNPRHARVIATALLRQYPQLAVVFALAQRSYNGLGVEIRHLK